MASGTADLDDAMILLEVIGDSMDASPESHPDHRLGHGFDGARIVHRHGNEVACISPAAAYHVDGQRIGICIEALGLGLDVETGGRLRRADDRTIAGVSIAIGAAAPADI